MRSKIRLPTPLKIPAMRTIAANDLKLRGVGMLDEALATQAEASVTVRGQPKYVVMHLAQYQHLRECELEAALAESRQDLAAGRFVAESVDAHLQRLARMNAAKAPKAQSAAKPRTRRTA
jgi:PHD/YefM family antitoxin component YafN of YafNO toxin-antitoxin module